MKALQVLIDLNQHQQQTKRLEQSFKSIDTTTPEEKVLTSFSSWNKSSVETDLLTLKWKKIPLAKRNLAEQVKAAALQAANYAIAVRDTFSGDETKTIKWKAVPEAFTTTSVGDQYPGRNKYRKTDANHTVILSPEWAPDLVNYSQVVELSKRDHLPLIGLQKIEDKEGNHVFSAVWVTGKKSMKSQEGWIAARGEVLFHSLKSADHALKGLKNKINGVKKKNYKQALLAMGPHPFKNQKIIKLREVQAVTGWCSPGCKEWLSRNMNGKTKAPWYEVADAARVSNDSYGDRLLSLLGAPKEKIKYSDPRPFSVWI